MDSAARLCGADLSGKQFHYFMVYDKISPDGAFNSAKAKDLISML